MAKLPNIKLNLNMDNIALGITIRSYLDWGSYGLLKFDKRSDQIVINEKMLMTLIKMVNPAQLDRKIKIISEDSWLDING